MARSMDWGSVPFFLLPCWAGSDFAFSLLSTAFEPQSGWLTFRIASFPRSQHQSLVLAKEVSLLNACIPMLFTLQKFSPELVLGTFISLMQML